MHEWRNGILAALRWQCSQGRGGSNPLSCTNEKTHAFVWVFHLCAGARQLLVSCRGFENLEHTI